MFKLNENYYQRKCFFEREPQVPTQTQMKEKMGVPLANVYFKSMPPKIKVLAGLSPVMKGGGANWYMPPEDILKSRHVLKPIRREYLAKLSHMGIYDFAARMHEEHFKRLEEEKIQALQARDEEWKEIITEAGEKQWEEEAEIAAKHNTALIQQAFLEFSIIYRSSFTKIETLISQAAEEEILRVKNETFLKMQKRYERLLQQQATTLYDRFAEKLLNRKEELKNEFVNKITKASEDTWKRAHDINVEKHIAVEKLRHLLECQNLACQVYVALKEREECAKEMQQAERKYEKKVKHLEEQIALKEFNITLAAAKEKKCREVDRMWQKKVCHIIKKFQIFVSFCLNTLPEYAEFFLNTEKLMMLQLDRVVQDPSSESIFEPEPPKVWTPVRNPLPFYLCCEKSYKPPIDRKLCPVHCSASAEQFPVVVINKRCIYAACDNFNLFTDKIKDFVDGSRGDDEDSADDHDYTYDVPVRYTSSTHIRALKLESSLMQILQTERANIRGLLIECCACRLPYCFCSPPPKLTNNSAPQIPKSPSVHSVPSGEKITSRNVELRHQREPKWKSYIEYVKPKRCTNCPKIAKHHLNEHLPPYMKNMSPFAAPDLPNYEMVDLDVLKRLVEKAQRKSKPVRPTEIPSKSKDASTQYADQEFELICNCFTAAELEKLRLETNEPETIQQFEIAGTSCSDDLKKSPEDFAEARAFSLRNLLEDVPELEEIFRKPTCSWLHSPQSKDPINNIPQT